MGTGADLVVQLLLSEGVDRVFGNPGSTELGFVDAVVRCPDLTYTLGLHEGCVIPMADGYAQTTGRPAFVNLHTMSGLGNAVGVLANAKANGTPLVVTAGQQTRDLLVGDPLLGYDLVAVAQPVCKWAREVRTEAELGILLRRAFLDAVAPPSGPVFLSIPHDLMLEPTSLLPPPRSTVLGPGPAAGLEEIAKGLAGGSKVALILGHEAGTTRAVAAAVRLAERLGAPVFGAAHTQRGTLSPRHPLWAGEIAGVAEGVRQQLAPFDLVFFVGGQPFQLILGSGPVLPEGCRLIHLAPEPTQIGRTHPVMLGAFGDLPASLEALAGALEARLAPRAPGQPRPREPQADIDPDAALSGIDACRLLFAALPADATVHNEAPSVGHAMRGLFDWKAPDQFYASRQTIGWAMGAAIGVALGHERKRLSLAVVGDGSASFSLPALWTAAREEVPVIFAILDNQSYGILETMSQRLVRPTANASPAFDLSSPPLDFVAIAKGFGVSGTRVTTARELRPAIEEAVAARQPRLLQIKIRG